jgi:hypothetical protein
VNTLLANQAIDLAIAAILTAVAGVIGSVAFCIRLWGQQRVQGTKLQAVKEQVEASGGATPTTVVVSPPQVAGGPPPLRAQNWNQLNDPLPDQALDPYRTVDCGEECTAMAIEARGGPSLSAYVLRALLGPKAGQLGTTAEQLVYLLALFKIASHPRQCDAYTAWTEWQHSYAAGFLVIALGYWVSIGYPHWVLIRECDDVGITFNDPWGGQVRSLDKATAQKLYQGQYVHIDQPVSAPAPPPP